jgi:Beta-lactamase
MVLGIDQSALSPCNRASILEGKDGRHMRRQSRRTLLAGVAAVLVPLPALAQIATKEKVAAALPKLKEFAQLVIDKKLVPGLSIAIVHRDEVAFLGAVGVRQVDESEPVDADTVFQLASLSKPLASTVVSALVSEGKVSWDSRIRDIDPGFALQDELAAAAVTVGDLFAHRSGLAGHVGDDIEELGFSQGEILQRLLRRCSCSRDRPWKGRSALRSIAKTAGTQAGRSPEGPCNRTATSARVRRWRCSGWTVAADAAGQGDPPKRGLVFANSRRHEGMEQPSNFIRCQIAGCAIILGTHNDCALTSNNSYSSSHMM